MAAATKLRKLVEDKDSFLLCPGVQDGFSARVALEVGFDGIYMVCYYSNTSPMALMQYLLCDNYRLEQEAVLRFSATLISVS